MGVTIQSYEFWKDIIIPYIAICHRHSKMCKKLSMNEIAEVIRETFHSIEALNIEYLKQHSFNH